MDEHFELIVKPKKGANLVQLVNPFPGFAEDNIASTSTAQLDLGHAEDLDCPQLAEEVRVSRQYCSIFTGISVEICDKDGIRDIGESYGRGSKSRSVPQVVRTGGGMAMSLENSETLLLGLEESFFLAFILKILRVYDMQNKQMSSIQFVNAARNINPNFLAHCVAYIYLKSKGWIIRSGIKWGGTFVLYKRSPCLYHASFVVLITMSSEEAQTFATTNIKGIQRISEAANKDILILHVNLPQDIEMSALADFANANVSELVIRRFNYSKYVNSKNSKQSESK